MPQIHLPTSTYTAPGSISGWQWLPFTNKTHLATLQSAILLIDSKVKNFTPCNNAFKALSGKKTFLQVWNDKSIWISFDPDKKGTKYGVTLNKKHISITQYALSMGKWTTAATLVHELAHVNGAPGTNQDAENTLLSCMLKSLHDPTIIGKIKRANDLKDAALA
jgi:hypothetical protein